MGPSTTLVLQRGIFWWRRRHVGLCVHQMIGIDPEKARELYEIPDGSEAWTGLAIGYRGDPNGLPGALRERDLAPRRRKPLEEFVFGGRWGSASPIVAR